MLFTEPVFLFIFLPVLLALHVAPGPAWRNGLLLAASVIFYARGAGEFTWFLAASILLNYWAAIVIDRYRDERSGRRLLVLTVAANVTALGVFKYADFAVRNVNAALGSLGVAPVPLPGLALPIGISFFTFHAVSYVVDVYRKDAAAQKAPVQAALYLLLFPQLIAGPIVRYREIADQLARRRASMDDLAAGIQRFVIGLGKKMLVANVVAVPVDRIFAMPAGSADRGARVARDGLLRDPDLLRLLRLLGHGDRARAHVRLPLPRELPISLLGAIDPGLLAPLAHLAVRAGFATTCTCRSAATAGRRAAPI